MAHTMLSHLPARVAPRNPQFQIGAERFVLGTSRQLR
jgi:hypothetical protein